MDAIEESLTITSDIGELAQAREWISNNAKAVGLSEEEVSDLELVVTEACTNSIKHAYQMEAGHEIILSLHIDPRRIALTVRDFGKKIDPRRYYSPDLNVISESGYGIFLMRSLMDTVEHDVSSDAGTELKMVKFRGGQENG